VLNLEITGSIYVGVMKELSLAETRRFEPKFIKVINLILIISSLYATTQRMMKPIERANMRMVSLFQIQ
jgi:hypothetical protein